jgi:hypothetical protein
MKNDKRNTSHAVRSIGVAVLLALASIAAADEGLGGGFNSITDIATMAKQNEVLDRAAAEAGEGKATTVIDDAAAAGLALLEKLGRDSQDGSSS